MKEEYNYNDFKDKIKDNCVVCLEPIKNSWEQYQIKGNYCSGCNVRCARTTKTVEGKEFRQQVLEQLN